MKKLTVTAIAFLFFFAVLNIVMFAINLCEMNPICVGNLLSAILCMVALYINVKNWVEDIIKEKSN